MRERPTARGSRPRRRSAPADPAVGGPRLHAAHPRRRKGVAGDRRDPSAARRDRRAQGGRACVREPRRRSPPPRLLRARAAVDRREPSHRTRPLPRTRDRQRDGGTARLRRRELAGSGRAHSAAIGRRRGPVTTPCRPGGGPRTAPAAHRPADGGRPRQAGRDRDQPRRDPADPQPGPDDGRAELKGAAHATCSTRNWLR